MAPGATATRGSLDLPPFVVRGGGRCETSRVKRCGPFRGLCESWTECRRGRGRANTTTTAVGADLGNAGCVAAADRSRRAGHWNVVSIRAPSRKPVRQRAASGVRCGCLAAVLPATTRSIARTAAAAATIFTQPIPTNKQHSASAARALPASRRASASRWPSSVRWATRRPRVRTAASRGRWVLSWVRKPATACAVRKPTTTCAVRKYATAFPARRARFV